MSEGYAIEMPLGLPGVTERHGFVVESRAKGSVYLWLRSAGEPPLTLLTVDIMRLFPDYPLAQVRRSLGFLHLLSDEPLQVLALCTVPTPPTPATANLLAPIGVGRQSGRAAQVVLHDGRWSDKTPLPG